jgi:hypothetical protein
VISATFGICVIDGARVNTVIPERCHYGASCFTHTMLSRKETQNVDAKRIA